MPEEDGEMNFYGDDTRPKYACARCGSNEVRGEFDTCPVFRAEGDRIIYLRSETYPDLSALYCNNCHADIEIENIDALIIE